MAIFPDSIEPSSAPIQFISAGSTHNHMALDHVPLSTNPDIPAQPMNTSLSWDDVAAQQLQNAANAARNAPAQPRKSPTKARLSRDSLKRREQLVRGKEGSRRRQRWENGQLMNNPYAREPEPEDWEVRPVYKKKKVHYEIATLWDHPTWVKAVKKPNDKKVELIKAGKYHDAVPKELKMRLKKSGHTAVGLLRNLEEEIRRFITGGNYELPDEKMEEDDFVLVEKPDGEAAAPTSPKKTEQKPEKKIIEKQILESLESDPAASFGRWMVHSIAKYYGLRSWSVTVDEAPNIKKRIAYVGMVIKRNSTGAPVPALEFGAPEKNRRAMKPEDRNEDGFYMPQPLWCML
ncbi:hypothetical protein BJ508DRAFT_410327 [Ascobolus immersus RN42]|uniref:R3H-associated N-terminal domain-containing protein n=1 Tax=Ascobolus immersus RN42 TaxID=1160509 RepID=A0A3N4J0X1_ASCIM|nr:hypothetical protein BJ508DRAFT_410327 [Ascobolus immersus RN42]